MIVIVGHGPSANENDKGLADWLDQQTVIRLKRPKVHPGTRTDYYCARHLRDRAGKDKPFWLFPRENEHAPSYTQQNGYGPVSIADKDRWYPYWHQFSSKPPAKPKRKPSTGLCAIFCAIEFLDAKEIGLIGFDAFFHDDEMKVHNMAAERDCVDSLDLEVINLG